MYRISILALALSWTFSAGVSAEDPAPAAPSAPAPMVQGSEDAVPGLPFQEGDVLALDQIDKLAEYLPPPFWENRRYFFFEGMQLEIGPSYRKYGESDAYRNVTNENRGKASIGRDGSLAGVRRRRIPDSIRALLRDGFRFHPRRLFRPGILSSFVSSSVA